MSFTDVLVILWVGIFVVQGVYRGLMAQAFSLVGLALGALAGSWIAPKFLAENSPWVSIASLAGAVIGAGVWVIRGAPVGVVSVACVAVSVGKFRERARVS